jgi:hypothetical protein
MRMPTLTLTPMLMPSLMQTPRRHCARALDRGPSGSYASDVSRSAPRLVRRASPWLIVLAICAVALPAATTQAWQPAVACAVAQASPSRAVSRERTVSPKRIGATVSPSRPPRAAACDALIVRRSRVPKRPRYLRLCRFLC